MKKTYSQVIQALMVVLKYVQNGWSLQKVESNSLPLNVCQA